MKNILFYKYVNIEDPQKCRDELFTLCQSLDTKGKILVAEEGINGCISGTETNLEKFKKELTNRFSDIVFKEDNTNQHTFKKIFVRVRKEIITSKFGIKLENKAPYVEPKQLKEWLDNNEDLIMVDARNDYEVHVGKFKNAIDSNIQVFTQWPKILDILKDKNKKIVTYCTGGIRCEKASAVLIENGFKNVFQLQGGILTYGKECGNAHWEGKCFVFDERGAADIDPNNQSEPISTCITCRTPTINYHNCSYITCDKMFIACPKCNEQLAGCCSKNCRNIMQRDMQKA